MNKIFTQLAPLLETIVEAIAWVLEKYAWVMEKMTGWGGKAGTWISDKLTSIRRASAMRDIVDFAQMADGEWQKVDVGKMNSSLGKAKNYLAEHPEIEGEYTDIMKVATDRLGQINRARYNALVNAKAGDINNKATVNIENQNIYTDTERAGKDVGKATETELGKLQFNSANLAVMGV